MICKKNFSTVLFITLIILFTSFFNVSQSAIQKGGLEYNADRFDYSALDIQKLIYEGNLQFNKALKETQTYNRNTALDIAIGKYYLVIKADPKNAYAYTQLARIYLMKNEDKYANSYFFSAVNIEPKNPHTNYHFGEYYFKKSNYRKALEHYLIAYENGYDNNYNLNCRLGIVYEKLADLENAKRFYRAAAKINPQKKALYKKIQNIESLDYGKSEYYYIIRE